jgi:hypothetical protein
VRRWVPLAWALGCHFDEGGLGSGSTALGASSEGGTTAMTTYAGGSEGPPPTTSSEGSSAADSTTGAPGSEGSSGAPGPCEELQWWDGAWTRRRVLSVAGLGLTDALDQGVAMLRIDTDRIDYGHTGPGGADLRFVLDGVALAYDVERWDSAGDSWVWLRLPQVPAEADAPLEVAMYYGNEGAPKGADAASTWAGYTSVHHLEGLDDATGNGHEASSPSEPSANQGRIAGAQQFDGVDDYLVLPNEADFDYTAALTVEAVVRVDMFDTEWQAIVTKGDHAWRLSRHSWSSAIGFATDNADGPESLQGMAAIDDDQWHYVAATFDGVTKRIYVDGDLDADQVYAGPLVTTNEPVMFGENAGHTGRQFLGRIDEVRISATARPLGYFAWQAHSLEDEVVTWGDEESCE